MADILEKIKTSERYLQLMDVGKSHGFGEAETTGQLLFTVMFNGVVGMAANLVAAFARLDTISEEDREELREEALAALKKHGGLTGEALAEMPKIEISSWKCCVLVQPRISGAPLLHAQRLSGTQQRVDHGRLSYIYYSFPCPYFQIEAGERVYASSYWTLRDPAVFDKPDDFVWRRFLGPEGKARREHHVIFHGRLIDTPAPDNHMCPGKDVGLSVIKGSIAILNAFFGWELEEPPVWTGTDAARLGQPDNEVKIRSFWLQHPNELKEIFPSHVWLSPGGRKPPHDDVSTARMCFCS
uniref:Uncharacterized protein n=1 Tax=Branchiostoma floridae TaxID=7739 RepID=C3YGY3_BRAFL|eukprot:XP_002604443.1 hypothetical protein BRAFLDRAFT_79257 [Branchiostoma floridae]